MKRIWKRLFALALTAAMVLSLLPVAAFAARVEDDAVAIAAPGADLDEARPAGAADTAEVPAALAEVDPPAAGQMTLINPDLTVSASSEIAKGEKEHAIDGEITGAQWSSADMKTGGENANPDVDQTAQWLTVDLGEDRTYPIFIDSIKLWYNVKVWPMEYKIQTSATGEENGTWTDLVSVTRDPASGSNSSGWVENAEGQDIADNAANTDTITKTSSPALAGGAAVQRYVRFYVEKVNTKAGGDNVSLREIQIYAPIKQPWNLAKDQPTDALSVANGAGHGLAVDGDLTSAQWNSEDMKTSTTTESDPQTAQWLWVDLGYTGSQIEQIKLWYNVKVWPMVYELQTSDDPGGPWERVVRVERSPSDGWVANANGQDIADTAANTDTITATSSPSLQTTTLKRYVRFYVEKVNTAAGGHNINLREIEIFGVNENRHQPVDVAELLAGVTNETISVNGATVTLPDAPAGGTLTVAGSTLENVVANDGTIGGKNIGAREVKLLVRAWDDQNPDNYQQKNLTVTVPDHKSAYPAAWFPSVSGGNAKPEVIPAIQEWYGYTGSFTLTENSRIVINDAANVGLQKAAENMKADVKEISGLDLSIVTGNSGGANDIYIESLATDDYDLGKEGYLMRVSDEGIQIYAPTYTGCIFGTITVEQILWQAADHLSVPRGIMRDYPAYEVRGVKLDIARTPYRYQQLKDYAKIMLWYKMSEYDLHINDNDNAHIVGATMDTHSGFHRLESKTFPSLTSGTKHAGIPQDLVNADYYNNNTDYHGNPVYTKDEWRALQQLAQDYGMYLLTEIDLPAHSLAYNKYAQENPDNISWLSGGTMATENSVTNTLGQITSGHLELLDLTGGNKSRALQFARTLWNEYTSGDEPTIYGDIVHIGADEYWIHTDNVNDAFAAFVDEMRGIIQGNLGTDTKIRMWGAGAGSGSFRTATTVLDTTHAKLAETYQLDVWHTNYENPAQRAKEGYGIVNCRDSFLYGNPGRSTRDVPNAEYLFNNWNPTMFGGNNPLLAEPNLLGAKAVLWGDQSQEGMTERDVHQRVLRAIAIVSEKTWGGLTQSEGSFSDYEMRAARLAEGPGTQIAMKVESETSLVLDYDFKNISANGTTIFDQSGNGYNGALNAAGTVDGDGFLTFDGSTLLTTDLKTLSYPYTVSFDLKLDAGNTKESSLFSGYDGRIQAAGHNGKLSADVNYFTRDFNYTVPTNGTAVNITLVGTFQATRLYVNGALVTFLSQKADNDGVAAGNIQTLYSSILLPLEKIGQNLHGKMANLKVYNKAMSAAEVKAAYDGTDDGLVNVAQNAIAGGSSSGGANDNNVQRVCIAAKAVDGEDFTDAAASDTSTTELWSYWRADDGSNSLTVDLGQTRSISQIVTHWRGTAPSSTIQTSANGTTWNSFTSGTAVNARYVKVNANGAGNLQELLVYERVDKTDLADMLERAEALVESKDAGFESTGEDAALFEAVVFARAAQNSPLATKADVAKAVEGLEPYADGSEPSAFTVTVSGTAKVGQSLTATLAPANATATYQWFRVEGGVETAISGATGAQYTLTADDVGKTVFVEATGTGSFGGTVSSTPTATVTEATTPPQGEGGGNNPSGSSSSGNNAAATPEDTPREDGATVTTTTKPNGDKVETVEQTDGTTSETVTARNGDKVITVTDAEGEELVKVELPAQLPVSETEFADVPADHWAKESINKMKGLGLVNGVGGGLYDTGSSVTRGALATVLHRLSNGKTDYKVAFTDVRANKYYTQGVAWAAKAKVVTGYTADIFAPDDTITREQLAVMMVRYAKLIGMDTTAKAESLEAFVDGDTTGAWAVDGMAWCVENGILKGKGENNLDPAADVSRAEVAVMLDRFIALIQK